MSKCHRRWILATGFWAFLPSISDFGGKLYRSNYIFLACGMLILIVGHGISRGHFMNTKIIFFILILLTFLMAIATQTIQVV